MMDCSIANTSTRNCEINGQATFSRTFSCAGRNLIQATQRQLSEKEKGAPVVSTETTASIADAMGYGCTKLGGQRIHPLCNEHTFTINHAHLNIRHHAALTKLEVGA